MNSISSPSVLTWRISLDACSSCFDLCLSILALCQPDQFLRDRLPSPGLINLSGRLPVASVCFCPECDRSVVRQISRPKLCHAPQFRIPEAETVSSNSRCQAHLYRASDRLVPATPTAII